MKTRIMYLELKTGEADRGPAWIGKVEFSRSGKTIYFNGSAFRKAHRGGSSNYYDVRTGEPYWISGVKKDGQDRHWAGGGKVLIDKAVVDDYLGLTGIEKLDTSYLLVEIPQTNKAEFHDLENE